MNRSRAYISLILCALFIFSSLAVASGNPRAEIEAARQAAQAAREAAAAADRRAEDMRAEARALDATIARLHAEVRDLDPQITEATSRTARLNAEVDGLEAEIATKESEIEKTKAEYEHQQNLLNQRMVASYKQGGPFIFISMLLDAKNVSDLIERTALVQRVITADNNAALALIHTREQLEAARNELDLALAAAASKRAEAVAVETNLRTLRSQRQSALDRQQQAQDEKVALVERNAADAERWRAEAAEQDAAAAQREAELRAIASQGSGQYLGGIMAWPVPGGSLTSGYGWRNHPVFGGQQFHHGIDISRGDGTIVAAGDGTVIRASYGWNGGFGNLVIIDHGDGLTTVYAHIMDGGIFVSDGQRVTQGEAIARVGSTGWSTGPHLHFEVRVNGASTDPMGFLR